MHFPRQQSLWGPHCVAAMWMLQGLKQPVLLFVTAPWGSWAPHYLLSCTQSLRAGCKSQRGQLHPWGKMAGKGNRRAPAAPVLVQDDEKNTGFFNTLLNYCNDCARSFPHFPFKRSWACYSDCINAKNFLLKKQTVLSCSACHSEDLSTKKLS